MSRPGQWVLDALRKIIASGGLATGERRIEIRMAELFGGGARMPVRTVFSTLEQSGLVVRFGGRRGSIDEIAGAAEVRGVLEGWRLARRPRGE